MKNWLRIKNLRLPDISFEGPAENRPSEFGSLIEYLYYCYYYNYFHCYCYYYHHHHYYCYHQQYLFSNNNLLLSDKIQGKSERNSKLEYENEGLIIKFK